MNPNYKVSSKILHSGAYDDSFAIWGINLPTKISPVLFGFASSWRWRLKGDCQKKRKNINYLVKKRTKRTWTESIHTNGIVALGSPEALGIPSKKLLSQDPFIFFGSLFQWWSLVLLWLASAWITSSFWEVQITSSIRRSCLPPWLAPLFLGSRGCDGGGIALLASWWMLSSK